MYAWHDRIVISRTALGNGAPPCGSFGAACGAPKPFVITMVPNSCRYTRLFTAFPAEIIAMILRTGKLFLRTRSGEKSVQSAHARYSTVADLALS